MAKVKLFDINDYLLEHRVVSDNQKDEKRKHANDFQEVVRQIKKHFDDVYSEDKLPDSERVKRQLLEHNATVGDKDSEQILIGEIERYLRENNLIGVKYPPFFDSLAHAIFHEIYRFGVFYKWNMFPESPSAKITGKEIWFKIDGKFVKQEEEFESEEYVNEVIRAIKVGNKGLKINEANPQGETELKDGTRITIVVQPRSLKPTIIFRRFIVSSFSFMEQAARETIAKEDIRFFDCMANLYLNTIIAGHVESGKSTMLKTFYASRDEEKVAVLIESSPETYLKRDFPERLVHDFYTLHDDVNQVIRTALRVDHDYLIVQEVRGIEAEGAISGTERGTRGLLMTYHITYPEKTAEQLAQHIVDVFPNRKLVNEIRRISKQLDIGITMQNFKGNKKKVTSVYEICYDYETDKAWINYLIRYNKHQNKWEYNGNVSDYLLKRMEEVDLEKARFFVRHLQEQAKKYPMTTSAVQSIIFKE